MSLRIPVSDSDHAQGNPDARIVLVEYGDYQCPHCGRAYPIVKKTQEGLGNQLRFVFRNFPLTQAHPQAMLAAAASEAAALQGKFWEMHDLLFENQRNLGRTAIHRYAEQLKLDMNAFDKVIDDPETEKNIEAEFYSGMRSGVNATPTFFLNAEIVTESWEGDGLYNFIRSRL
jgi:protein-disulfide isomerase